MADGAPISDVREIAQVARIFKCAAHALRLHVLLALEPGECATPRLQDLFRDLDWRQVGAQLQVLYEEGLVKRRSIGDHAAYSLSKAGLGVAHSCHTILHQLGYDTTGPPCMGDAKADVAPPKPTRQSNYDESIYAIDAASLLNHGANPLRLRLLFSLSEKDRGPAELSHELGGVDISTINRNLTVLEDGKLVSSHRHGKQYVYTLALNGLSLIQVIRATCSSLTIRRGELVLRPEPIKAGEHGALDPTSPEGLACLLKAFADPIRIRVLNVLVAAGEICSCHLPEALQLPRRLVIDSMAYARKTGLVLDRHEHSWVFLRPSPSASDLCRSLIGCFGLRLNEAHTLEADRRRLQNLHPCLDAPASGRPADGAAPPTQTPSSGHERPATRTA